MGTKTKDSAVVAVDPGTSGKDDGLSSVIYIG